MGSWYDDRHPARGGRGGPGQRCTGSHAPQKLCRRRPTAAYRFRELVTHGLKRQDNDVLYESSPEAVERFERKLEEMWVKASNTIATIPER